MKDSLRLVVVTTTVCLISALLVSIAHEVTLEPIAKAAERYYATDKGYAFEMLAPNGYAGPIKLMLGFTKDGRFWSYRVLAHTETPGLGAHVAGSFLDHVKDRKIAETKWKTTKDGGDIVPITSATISSRAVCDAIARGVQVCEAIHQQEAR